jgi:hypothetical protein
MHGAARAAAHVRAIAAAPRPAGGDVEAGARAYCASELAALGFTITEEDFDYSDAVGRWATPAIGLLTLVAMLAAAWLGSRAESGLALLVLACSLIFALTTALLLARWGVTGFPAFRRRGVNLVARRGDPSIWLVAHLDSKSQPVPILVRAVAIALTAVVWSAAIAVAAAQWLGAPLAHWWPVIAIVGTLAELPVILTTVGARSAGALDNASGVATVLLAASSVDRERPLGVLLPSAEELGLAGARAWAARNPASVAINCDGVDDAGVLSCMYSGRRPDRLADALRRAGERLGTPVRVHRLLPGVLMDGVALADAGWEVANVSKGTLATLARIHTPRDVAEAIRGDGIASAARLIAETLREVD